MKTIEQIEDSNIVVDTNILINYAKEGFSDRSGQFLEKLAESNNLLVSAITIYELFSNSKNSEIAKKLESSYREFIENLEILNVDKSIVFNVAVMRKWFNDVYGGGQFGGDKVGDFVIASTVLTIHITENIQKPVYLVTADRKDFREPIWLTESHVHVPKSHEEASDAVNLYALKINDDLLHLIT